MEKCIECIHHNICSDWARECYNGDTCFPYEAEKNLCVWYEPVRHGEWLHKNGEMYCSVCGGEALVDEVYYQSPYCPECGTKMDGGNK